MSLPADSHSSDLAHGSANEGIASFETQTLRAFAVMLAAIALVGGFSYGCVPRLAMVPLGIADSILWILCGWLGWRQPSGMVVPLFTIVTGLFVGQLAHSHSSVFFTATVFSIGAFSGLAAYAHFSRRDFSFLQGFLCVSFMVLIIGGVLAVFVHSDIYQLLYSGFGVIVFAAWILYDIDQIVSREDASLTPTTAALELLLDLIGLHRWLLDHLNLWNSRDTD